MCISSNAQARDLIARGARLAEALSAELYVLHVATERDEEPERKRTRSNRSLHFAENLGAHDRERLPGSDTARVTADLRARTPHHTGHCRAAPRLHGLKKYLYYLAIQKFMAEAPHVDLHIVTQEDR